MGCTARVWGTWQAPPRGSIAYNAAATRRRRGGDVGDGAPGDGRTTDKRSYGAYDSGLGESLVLSYDGWGNDGSFVV